MREAAVPASTIVCCGGIVRCGAFKNGNGMTSDTAGKLSGNSIGIGDSVASASKNHCRDIRAAGGQVVNDHDNYANAPEITAEQSCRFARRLLRIRTSGRHRWSVPC